MKTSASPFPVLRFAPNWLLRVSALAAVLLMTASSRAAIDVFLKLYPEAGQPAVVGESRDKAFPGSDGWFEISQFNFGIENTITFSSATGGAGAGKANFSSFTLTKPVDSVSPALFKAAATGTHFKGARLVIRKAGGTTAPAQPYLIYDFNLVFVSSQNWSGNSGDDTPTESIKFEYGALQLTYRTQKADGTLVLPGTTQTWNVVENDQTFVDLGTRP